MRRIAVFLALAGLLFFTIVGNPFGIACGHTAKAQPREGNDDNDEVLGLFQQARARFGGAESHGVRYGIARAQTGGPYDLSWSTVDGGGHTGSPFGTAWRFGGAKSHCP